MRRLVMLSVVAALGAALRGAQEGGRRLALVIDNGQYQDLVRLKNAVNDAQDVAAALSQPGLAVRKLTDGILGQMMEAVEQFARGLAGAQAGLFFYAGHGVQSEEVNYLVPVDAKIDSEYQLRFKALSVQYVLKAMNSALNIVVLDACRDNRFTGFRSAARGLAVAGNAPPGEIIVYVTDPGKTAAPSAP